MDQSADEDNQDEDGGHVEPQIHPIPGTEMVSLGDCSPFLDQREPSLHLQASDSNAPQLGSDRSENPLQKKISELIESMRTMVDSGEANLTKVSLEHGDLMELIDDNELDIEESGLQEWLNARLEEVDGLIRRAMDTTRNVAKELESPEDNKDEDDTQLESPGSSRSETKSEDLDPIWLDNEHILVNMLWLRHTVFMSKMYEPYTHTHLGRHIVQYEQRILPCQPTLRQWLQKELAQLAQALQTWDVGSFRSCVRQYRRRWWWRTMDTVEGFMTALYSIYHRNIFYGYHERETMTIECKVNGHTAIALVDTGSEETAITEALAKRVGIYDQINKNPVKVMTGVQGQDDSAAQDRTLGNLYSVPIEINGGQFAIDVEVVDTGGIPDDVLIGMDFLGGQKCTVYCQAIHAAVHARRLLAQENPAKGVSLTSKLFIGELEAKMKMMYPRPLISCLLNKRKQTALLDTGTATCLISRKMLNDCDIKEDLGFKPILEYRGGHTGVGGQFVDSGLVPLVDIEIGDGKEKLRAQISLTILEQGHQEYFNIGMDFLGRHGCVIDCFAQEVTFGYLKPEGIEGPERVSVHFVDQP